VLGHEVAHRLAAKNRTLNDWLGNMLCFWPTIMCLPAYRAFHFENHRFVGNERDPESLSWSLAGYQKPKDRRELARRLLADLVGLRLGDLVVLQRSIGPRSLQEWLPIAAFAVTTTVVFVLLSLWWVPVVWLIALSLPAHACFRLRALHEHMHHGGTYLTSCGVVGRFLFFPHNTWCHAEHHETSGVAARWLPRLRDSDTRRTPWHRVFRPGEQAAVVGLVAPETCGAKATQQRSA
jgi:fatty acid desaturase